MSVFTFDAGLHNVVKIEKHGKKWYAYRLEKVILVQGDKHPSFIFAKSPFGSWSYQPFEDKDVKRDPETFLADVRRWQPQLVSCR